MTELSQDLNPVLKHLLTRRSVKAQNLQAPGPSSEELSLILQAAHRVPDHKKLGPWRFIVLQGERRQEAGGILANIMQAKESSCTEKLLEYERSRFMRAPLVVAVVFTPVEEPKAPEFEQILAVGAVCQNLINASTALGYGAQWLTEWYSYDENVNKSFGLGSSERFAGFIYLGSFNNKPEERARPELASRTHYF